MVQLEQLDERAQGVVLGALLEGRGGAALARIAEGPRCQEALRAFGELTPAQRRQTVSALTRKLLSPLPHHLERVHPSWIQALLQQESAPVVQVVTRALPAELLQLLMLPALPPTPLRINGAIQAQIIRSVLGQLCTMPPRSTSSTSAAPQKFEDLLAWRRGRLDACLEALGALLLASSLKDDPPLRQRALAGLPQASAALLRRALTSKATLSPRMLSVRLTDLHREQQALHRLGLRLLAAGCPSAALLQRQLAQRLPRELGRLILEEDTDEARDRPEPALVLRICAEADALARSGEGSRR